MPDALWGLWGGRPPGGWCLFKTASAYADGLGYGYLGTLEESEAGAEAFRVEQRERTTPWAYEPRPFDQSIEPDAVEDAPSEAQWRLLDLIRRLGTFNTHELPANYRRTADVLHERGWYMYAVDEHGKAGHLRLTAAGVRAWCAGAPKEKK